MLVQIAATDLQRCIDDCLDELKCLHSVKGSGVPDDFPQRVVECVHAEAGGFVRSIGEGLAALAAPTGVAGLHVWHRAVTGGDLLAGLEQIREDDDWHLGKVQETLNAGRSWDRVETLHVAAARLASRCDATDLFEAALLGDPLWRARGVRSAYARHSRVPPQGVR